MLTANQLILLGHVVRATEPPSTNVLSAVSKGDGSPFGENAARNGMKRMEDRGFVVGSGAGKSKTWTPTPAGRSAYTELLPAEEPPEPQEEDSSPKGPRSYVVLEECSLADAVREALPDDYPLPDSFYEALNGKKVYDRVHEPDARNTEHALRQTAKSVYRDATEDPTLVAVAGKMFRPTPVRLNRGLTVGIG